jgi:AcrR family transcriptional regulator
MVTENRARKYELRKRAENMADTRRRITEAAVALHGSIGPARTTVAAIAERAGVQRHTVYRHFPTDEDLFEACTGHYWALHPWPDRTAWNAIEEPGARLRTALRELYAFYADIEPMMTNVLRDAQVLPIVERAARSYGEVVDEVADDLAAAVAPGRALAAAALRHAVDFATWQGLVRRCGLGPDEAVLLMARMVEAAPADG